MNGYTMGIFPELNQKCSLSQGCRKLVARREVMPVHSSALVFSSFTGTCADIVSLIRKEWSYHPFCDVPVTY